MWYWGMTPGMTLFCDEPGLVLVACQELEKKPPTGAFPPSHSASPAPRGHGIICRMWLSPTGMNVVELPPRHPAGFLIPGIKSE